MSTKQSNRGRGSKNNAQSFKSDRQTQGGQTQAQTPKVKTTVSFPATIGQKNEEFEKLFMQNQDEKNKKNEKPVKNNTLAKTQSVKVDKMMDDDAILSIDPQTEDNKVPQRPPKFSNKAKTQTNKVEKSQSNVDGFAGDSRRKGQNQHENNNNQKGQRFERELTKASGSWVNSNGDENKKMRSNLRHTTLGDLEHEDDGVHYDQFANKNTTYSESLYTSQRPDLNNLSTNQLQKAERVAREIENKDAAGNNHLAEERGQLQQRDNDNEELMFSGVHRPDSKNYTQHNKKNNKQHSQNKRKTTLQTSTPQLKNKKRFSALQKEKVQDHFISILDDKVETIFQQRREAKIESTSLFNADNWKDFEHGHPSPDQMQNPYDDHSKGYKNNNNVKRRGSGYGQRGGHNQQYNNQGNYYNKDTYQPRHQNSAYQHNNRPQGQQQYGYKPAQQDSMANGSSAATQNTTLQYNAKQPAIFTPSKPNMPQPQTPTSNPSQQQAPIPVNNQIQPPNTTTNQSLNRGNTYDFKQKPQAFFPSNNQNPSSDNTGKQAQQQPSQGMSIDHSKNFVPKQSAQNPTQTSNMQSDNGQAQNESSSQGSQGMKFAQQQQQPYQAKPYYSGQQYQNKYQNNNSGQMSFSQQSNHQNQNAQNGYNNKYQNRQKPYGYGSYENSQYQQNGNQMQNNYSNNSAQPHGMDGSNGSNFNLVNNTQNFNQPSQQNNQYNQPAYNRSNTMPNYSGGNVGQQAHSGWQQFQPSGSQPPYAANTNQYDNSQSMNNGQGNFNNQQHRFSQNSQGQPQQQFSTTSPSFQPSPQGNASQPVAQPAAPADGTQQALKLTAQSFRPKEN